MAYSAGIDSIAVPLFGIITDDMGEINAHQHKRVPGQDPDSHSQTKAGTLYRQAGRQVEKRLVSSGVRILGPIGSRWILVFGKKDY